MRIWSNSQPSYCSYGFWSGKELGGLERETAKYSQALAQIKQTHIRSYQDQYWQVILNLLDRSEDPCRLVGQGYDETKMLPMIIETNDVYAINEFYLKRKPKALWSKIR